MFMTLKLQLLSPNVMDRREREYESDTAGMLGRSTNDFIKALIKK